MGDLQVNNSALEECLQALNHLFIDIKRLKQTAGYAERRGGYCDLQVATLDSGGPTAKLVAAKKLLLGIRSDDPKRLAVRLARELKVWAGLRHPHVLPLLGFYLCDEYKTALLISEYMVHGDLKDYISKMRPTCDQRLHLVCDLTEGLAYLHAQINTIRHGDLKPGNVLVNRDHRALLADFGLSKALDTDPTGFTTGNDARGTVRYSSPEILLGDIAGQSLKDDIWSWGCLVLEAMTDKMPFDYIKPMPQLILAIALDGTPSDLNSLSLHPPQLKDLLAKCWSRQPNDRPTVVDCLGVVKSALPTLYADSRASDPLDLPHSPTLARQQPNQHRAPTPEFRPSSSLEPLVRPKISLTIPMVPLDEAPARSRVAVRQILPKRDRDNDINDDGSDPSRSLKRARMGSHVNLDMDFPHHLWDLSGTSLPPQITNLDKSDFPGILSKQLNPALPSTLAPSTPLAIQSASLPPTSSPLNSGIPAAGLPGSTLTPKLKQFHCPLLSCGRTFKRMEHLKRHCRTHTMEKPFACDKCEKKFSRSDNLMLHLRTH